MRAFARPPLRPYLPDLRFVRAVGQGSIVLCRCGVKLLVRALRVVFSKRPEGAAEKDGTSPATPLADRVERVVGGVLVVLAGGTAAGAVTAGVLPRVAPYLPAASAVGVPLWVVAAWVAAPPAAPKKPSAGPVEALVGVADDTPEGRRLTFLRWLEKTTRNAPGIHLDQMHAQLTQHEPAKGMPRHHLRPLLQHYGIPVQRTLRVGAVSGRSGVTRQAIEEALAAAEQAPPPGVGTGRVESVVHGV